MGHACKREKEKDIERERVGGSKCASGIGKGFVPGRRWISFVDSQPSSMSGAVPLGLRDGSKMSTEQMFQQIMAQGDETKNMWRNSVGNEMR